MPVLARERNRLIEAIDDAIFVSTWATLMEDMAEMRVAVEGLVENQRQRDEEVAEARQLVDSLRIEVQRQREEEQGNPP